MLAKHKAKEYKNLAKKTDDPINAQIYRNASDDFSLEADFMKINLNSGLFGKLGYDGWLLDKAAMYKVTMNCQLLLLMLIERLELSGFHVVSANTDGIITKLPREKEDEYFKICNDWCNEVHFELEYTDYYKYIRTTVNDYIAIKGDFLISKAIYDVKFKGDFLTEIDVSKGYSMPIIAKAVAAYYIYGTPIADFIRNYNEPKGIYDFCLSQKIGSDYYPIFYEYIMGAYCETKLQKNIRYYVSNKGGTLYKIHKTNNKKIGILAGKTVTIFNDFYYAEMKDYDINYNFYIAEAMKIVNNISGIITKNMKKRNGTMFDEIE